MSLDKARARLMAAQRAFRDAAAAMKAADLEWCAARKAFGEAMRADVDAAHPKVAA